MNTEAFDEGRAFYWENIAYLHTPVYSFMAQSMAAMNYMWNTSEYQEFLDGANPEKLEGNDGRSF